MPTPSPARMHDVTVVSNEPIADGVYALVINAPKLAQTIKPGQFVNIAVPGNAMSLLRIPLSYASADAEAGTVEIWYAVVGDGTERLSQMKSGAKTDLLGPGGNGWTIPEGCRRALLVAGGIGVPPVLCLARELAVRSIPYTVSIGAASKGCLVGEDEFEAAGAPVISVATDDGSYGRHGNVCVPLNEMFAEGEKFDEVITIGPLIMMKFVVKATQPTGIPCTVSMNPIMVDGTGMCGGCRLTLHRDGESITKFACVDGPDFNGYEVDFDEAMSRGTTYKEFERAAHEHVCNLFKQEVK